MAFDLIPDNIEAQTLYQTSGNIDAVAGQRIQIRHGTPGNNTVDADWTVPAGKKWTIDIGVTVHEEDE